MPVVRQSNETEHRGRITKGGSKLGRTTLVQCTLSALRYSSATILLSVIGDVADFADEAKLAGDLFAPFNNDPLARLKRGGVAEYPDKSGELAKDCLATC